MEPVQNKKLVIHYAQEIEDLNNRYGVKYDNPDEKDKENDSTKDFDNYESAKKFYDEYEGECALWEYTPMPELIEYKSYEN